MGSVKRMVRRVRAWVDPGERIVEVARRNSLCSRERLRGLRKVARGAAERGVRGDFVECGVYRGGSSAVIAERLFAADPSMSAHLFDVFTGMPRPGADDPKEAWEDVGKFVSSEEVVRGTWGEVGLPLERLTVHVGLFEKTLPGFAPAPIAFLHVDCDWHDAVKLVLEKFYDSVKPGGTIVLDDYGHWSGCRKAADAFFAERGVKAGLRPIDYTSHWFVKG